MTLFFKLTPDDYIIFQKCLPITFIILPKCHGVGKTYTLLLLNGLKKKRELVLP